MDIMKNTSKALHPKLSHWHQSIHNGHVQSEINYDFMVFSMSVIESLVERLQVFQQSLFLFLCIAATLIHLI